ncbi:hypothetical protein FH972_022336 [Carpinus fangiana]|uniref:Uncharacterized protein n=1 Tax=Carpinus fangiana TaxID=176857 RepID=A0A5N6KRZ5_9ROSI|nr:hypothetical protein FH972_022336 [Carpinus fangiana]
MLNPSCVTRTFPSVECCASMSRLFAEKLPFNGLLHDLVQLDPGSHSAPFTLSQFEDALRRTPKNKPGGLKRYANKSSGDFAACNISDISFQEPHGPAIEHDLAATGTKHRSEVPISRQHSRANSIGTKAWTNVSPVSPVSPPTIFVEHYELEEPEHLDLSGSDDVLENPSVDYSSETNKVNDEVSSFEDDTTSSISQTSYSSSFIISQAVEGVPSLKRDFSGERALSLGSLVLAEENDTNKFTWEDIIAGSQSDVSPSEDLVNSPQIQHGTAHLSHIRNSLKTAFIRRKTQSPTSAGYKMLARSSSPRIFSKALRGDGFVGLERFVHKPNYKPKTGRVKFKRLSTQTCVEVLSPLHGRTNSLDCEVRSESSTHMFATPGQLPVGRLNISTMDLDGCRSTEDIEEAEYPYAGSTFWEDEDDILQSPHPSQDHVRYMTMEDEQTEHTRSDLSGISIAPVQSQAESGMAIMSHENKTPCSALSLAHESRFRSGLGRGRPSMRKPGLSTLTRTVSLGFGTTPFNRQDPPLPLHPVWKTT